MSGFLTLSTRGTDVILSALKLGSRFTREELVEVYGRLRLERDGVLPRHWSQGISNEIQRLGSEFAIFAKEHRKLDLIARRGIGQYSIRDSVRPLLLDAANEHSNLFRYSNTLLVPSNETAAVTDSPNKYNHLVGAFAQQKLMQWALQKGYEIVEDSSMTRAYDFSFRQGARHNTIQTMEAKGTRRSEIDVALTPNEYMAWISSASTYWLGIVYNIDVVDGRACGGSEPFVTPPPVLNRWQIVRGFKLRLISKEA
jgi:hypothetical protein